MRTLNTSATVACTVSLIIAGCATMSEKALQEKGMRPMTEAELRALNAQPMSGTFVANTGIRGEMRSTPDGKVSLAWPGGSSNGTYRINGNQVCSTHPTIDNGQERCLRVYQTGPNERQYFRLDGTYNSTVTVK